MATVKNRSTLGVRYSDANLKEKTFNIGYVNPDNSEATNKLLAQKVMALSNGSTNQIYVTDVTNITNANTDTNVTRIPLISSSDFLSMDSATWKAYITEKAPSGSNNIRYSMVSPAGSNESSPLDADFFYINSASSNISNSKDYAAYLSARLLGTTSTEPFAKITQTQSGVWYFETTGTGTFKIGISGSSNGTKSMLQDVFDKITQPSSGAQWTLDTTAGNVILRYQGTI